MKTLEGHTGGVLCVAITVDGSTIASGSSDKSVKLWDVSSGAVVQSLDGHAAQVTSLSFMEESSILSSTSSDGTQKTWDMNNFSCVGTTKGNTEGSPNSDNKVIASVSCMSLLQKIRFKFDNFGLTNTP